jgi:hypothetical protein
MKPSLSFRVAGLFLIMAESTMLAEEIVKRNFSDKQMDEIAQAWKKTNDFNGDLDIEWQHAMVEGASQFCQFQNTWAAKSKDWQSKVDDFAYRLTISNESFLFASQRWAVGAHRRDFLSNDLLARQPLQYTPYVQKYAESGNAFEFSSNLMTKFRDPEAEFLTPHSFSRINDGRRLIDTWHAKADSAARVTIRERMQAGSVAWARLTYEEDWNDQIDTLDMQAALLAFRKLDSPSIAVDFQRVSVRSLHYRIDGVECFVVDEKTAGNETHYRTFWLDPSMDFAVRRFIGTVPIDHSQSDAHRAGGMPGRLGRTQIDIDYSKDNEFGWQPTSWTVSAWPTHEYPLFAFVKSQVTSIVRGLRDRADKNLEHTAVPKNAWVIDEIANEQYIATGKDSKRIIAIQELQLQPQHQDLIATPSGTLVRREWPTPFWQAIQWMLALGGIAILLIGILRRFAESTKRQVGR